ncbi:MAG: 4Fe-4S dicluster domain-containing protein [Endomicrobia bacterium]|nr:4Fe-4S dicluster domain-containing protein [Endomicrobiia bacterium]MCX7940787.1 4Fe-4S dicluster domain-containing protein [Endomicrobiia bacterium]MDW8055615.1 4Fe-4S dicluster domain-containing protein [Elusimicrobiota bacterium]
MYLYIDYDKCRGCKTCVIVCSYRWNKVFSETLSAICVIKNEKKGKNFPIVCQQCSKPLCVDACLSGALKKDKQTGIVLHFQDKCVGCKMCVISCPFGGIGYVAEVGVARKCDLCSSFDVQPAVAQCEKMCPYKAIKVITEDKITSEIKKNVEKFLQQFGTYRSIVR